MRRKPRRKYQHVPFPPRRDLSENRAKVMAYIRQELADNGTFPTNGMIAAYMGYPSHSTVRDDLNVLHADGWLKLVGFDRRGARLWKVIEESDRPKETRTEAGHASQ